MKFIGYVRTGPAAFRVGPVGQMEGIRFHLCASSQFHACVEGLAVADEFHVPQSFRLAAAIVPRRREKVCSASIQSARYGKLRTEAGCGLRAREACPPFFASRAAVPHPVTVDSSSAIHLREQTPFQRTVWHICCRGGRKMCTPSTTVALPWSSDVHCMKS